MLSKGGKIYWLCGVCNSGDIVRCGVVVTNRIIYGLGNPQNDSYYCKSCSNYAPWQSRLKHSTKKKRAVVLDPAINPNWYHDESLLGYFPNNESFEFSGLGKDLIARGLYCEKTTNNKNKTASYAATANRNF